MKDFTSQISCHELGAKIYQSSRDFGRFFEEIGRNYIEGGIIKEQSGSLP